MGTNYYLHARDAAEPIHLGKQSAGWSFAFRAYPDPAKSPSPVTWPVTDTDSWFRLLDLPGNVRDEYGRILSKNELLDIIDRNIGKRNFTAEDFGEYVDDSGARFCAAEFC